MGFDWQTKPARKQAAWAWCCLKRLPKNGDRAWNRPANCHCHHCKSPIPTIPLYYAELDAKHKEDHAKGGKAAGWKGKGKADAKVKAVDKGKGKGKGKNDVCFNCGKKGHKKADCRSAPVETPLQQAQ